MDPELERTLLRRLFAHHRERTTATADDVRHQPVSAYLDADRFERECRLLFRARPLVVGLSTDLPEAGSFRALDVAGVPVLLVRGEDAVVRAFVNSCRHRGSPVARGSGLAERVFKCPYHAWCYDTGGRLVGQPVAQDAFAALPAAELGLVPLPAAEAGGLLLVTPSPAAPEIDGESHFAGLAPELASYGFERFVPFSEQVIPLACNWKQPYETFMEAYHVFALHRTTLAKQLLSTPMLADPHGPHGRITLTSHDNLKLMSLPESEWRIAGTTNMAYWFFPNAILSLPKSGHAELWLMYPEPGAPGRCRVHVRFYVPAAEAEPRADFWRKMVDYTTAVVLEEDFGQQVAIHAAISSGAHPGLVFGRNEPALIHYHETLDEVLVAGARGGKVHRLA